MTLASDQLLDDNALPEFSRQLLALRPAILAAWEGKVRGQIDAAGTLGGPILVDTFPTMFDNLVEALTPSYPRELATSGTTIAAVHGSERARMTPYQPHELVKEYQLLREAILEQIVAAKLPLPGSAVLTLNLSIDRAIIESVAEFSIVHNRLREFFIATLSHDMRTPLSTANMAAQLVHRKVDDPDVKTLMQTIMNSITRIDSMIEQLLDDLATPADGSCMPLSFSSFDMLELAREVCEAPPYSEGACAVSGDPSPGCWSRDTIKRALENLIGNAMKYGDGSCPVQVHLCQVEGRQLVSVHNDGKPIPAEKLEHIFTMFYRNEVQAGRGWGVGLPFVRAVAQSHGGSITVDSDEGRGTTFTLDVPVDASAYQPSQCAN
jgi:signal transduction histidine kinase